tara:strand:- start:47 stop:370 length:324 start_codon:yes stop_codon:yes gene_type:complete
MVVFNLNLDGFYDLDGLRTDAQTWTELMESGKNQLHNNKIRGYYVSTVLVGMPSPFGDGLLNIFESMVFDKKLNEILCKRCDTRRQADFYHGLLLGKMYRILVENKK